MFLSCEVGVKASEPRKILVGGTFAPLQREEAGERVRYAELYRYFLRVLRSVAVLILLSSCKLSRLTPINQNGVSSALLGGSSRLEVHAQILLREC
jgi:hypothetical protein